MSTGAFEEGAFRAPLAALDTGGGILSLANPEGVDLWVDLLIVNVTEDSAVACTADFGIGASATTKYDNLIDGLDVGTAPVVASNTANPGSNGKAGFLWPADEFLTGSMATGAAAGLEGEVAIKWVRL